MTDESDRPPTSPGGLVPRPDPTVLTTEAIRRDIEHLRELLKQEIGALRREFDAYRQHHDEMHDAERRTSNEQHTGFERELEARDRAVRAALDASLQSSAKTEEVTTKQIQSLHQLVDQNVGALRTQLNDVKQNTAENRADNRERTGRGVGSQQAWALAVAIAVAVIALVGLIIGFAM